MRNSKFGRIFCLFLAILFIMAAVICPVAAQNPFPDISTLTPETIFQASIEPMYGMLVILFGYLSGYIPAINKFAPFVRVAAFALVLGLGMYLFDNASMLKIAFTYFLSSGLYVVILKNILPSPKAVQ
jgi:hypothetical protein